MSFLVEQQLLLLHKLLKLLPLLKLLLRLKLLKLLQLMFQPILNQDRMLHHSALHQFLKEE
jgi:hypothetical protein